MFVASINLSKSIADIMAQYTDEVEKRLDDVFDEVAEEGIEKIQETAPKRYGKYAKSWKVKKKNKNRILHAGKPYHRLTHLLEKGHAKRNGRRVEAIPHISKVEEFINKEVISKTEKALRGIS